MFFHLICWSGSDWLHSIAALYWNEECYMVLLHMQKNAKYGGNMESHGAPLSLIIGQPQPGAAGRAHCFGAQMSGECGTAMDSADWFVQLP